MSRILVLYDSHTGHTARMAELVAEGARGAGAAGVRLRSLPEAVPEDVVWCRGIAVGSPTNLGIMSWPMKKFWDDLSREYWGKLDGRIGCAFSSSGGWGGGSELACQSLLTILINYGFLVFGLPDYVDKQLTLHYGAVVAGEPRSEAEQEACRRLGRRLVRWVRRSEAGSAATETED